MKKTLTSLMIAFFVIASTFGFTPVSAAVQPDYPMRVTLKEYTQYYPGYLYLVTPANTPVGWPEYTLNLYSNNKTSDKNKIFWFYAKQYGGWTSRVYKDTDFYVWRTSKAVRPVTFDTSKVSGWKTSTVSKCNANKKCTVVGYRIFKAK